MTRKNSTEMNKKERKEYNEYMRKYMINRYHKCDNFRNKVLSWTEKSYKKYRKKRLKYYRNYNIKNRNFMKEYNHLRFMNLTPQQKELEKQKLRIKYGIRQTIKCEVKK